MNRIDFIKSASVLAGGAFATAMAPLNYSLGNVAKPVSTPKFKKGLSYWMIEEELSLIDKFKLVKSLGFDGVEFDGPVNIPVAELLDARDKTGIEIPSLVNNAHWSTPLSDPNPDVRQSIIGSVATTLQQMKDFGGDTVLVVPGVVNEKVSYGEAYKNALDTLRKLIPHAERTGIQIGLENVWNNFILSPAEAEAFLAEINHPLIGWYFDTGNVLRYGWPEHWLQTLDSKVIRVHIKEFSKVKMDEEGLWKGFDVDLLEGSVDWQRVMTTLDEINYKGEWLIAELKKGDRHYLRQVSQRMDQIIGLT